MRSSSRSLRPCLNAPAVATVATHFSVDLVFQVSFPADEDEPPVFSCRLQWKARRAEIETLANKAEAATETAKRIPVLADVTFLRTFTRPHAPKADLKQPAWRYVLCFAQLWIQTFDRAFPPWAPCVLDFLGLTMHHPTQISLAMFAAYRLRDKIFNLDMLSIARTTKLSA